MNNIKHAAQRLLTYLKTGKFIKITPHRLEMLQKAMQYVKNEKVPGDYFEFGVARGLTFAGAYVLSEKYSSPIKTFHAFDSFEGFPELGSVDSEFERFKTGEESWTPQEFRQTLQAGGVPSNRVNVVTGWFKDSLNQELFEKLKKENSKVSIAWIDCDLYQSTKEALDFITPLLQTGSVLIFDDWFCYHADPDKGEMRAVSEFLTQNPNITLTEYHKFGIVGNSFIVKVK